MTCSNGMGWVVLCSYSFFLRRSKHFFVDSIYLHFVVLTNLCSIVFCLSNVLFGKVFLLDLCIIKKL